MLTIILSYCEEHTSLLKWVDIATEVCAQANDIHFIVVDDASIDRPAIAYLNQPNLPDNISLYRVTYNIGYNVYGCRNLAMMETSTQWNLLCNIGATIQPKDILEINSMINDGAVDPSTIYDFENSDIEKNVFLVAKETFWDVGGYDAEWTSMRGGQRTTIERLLNKYQKETLPFIVTRLTPPNKVTISERMNPTYVLTHFDKTRNEKWINDTIKTRLDSKQPPTLNFKWSKQL